MIHIPLACPLFSLTLQLLQDGHLHLQDLLRLARGFHLQGDLFPRDQILAFVDLAETTAADLFQDLFGEKKVIRLLLCSVLWDCFELNDSAERMIPIQLVSGYEGLENWS